MNPGDTGCRWSGCGLVLHSNVDGEGCHGFTELVV
jgi:hypothetical protein